MFCDYIPQASIQSLSVLVKHHGVGIAIKLLKAKSAVVFPLDFLDSILEQVPYACHILLIHVGLQIDEIHENVKIELTCLPRMHAQSKWVYNKKI